MKISWKTSYLVTWSTSNCDSTILKNDLKIDKLDAWRTRNNISWDSRNDISWRTRNLLAWKARNLNLAILIVFSAVCVTWTFDIFGNFKTTAWAFQCIYKGLKLSLKLWEISPLWKNEIAWLTSKNAFLRQFLCMFGYEKLHGKGINEFGMLWDDFRKS